MTATPPQYDAVIVGGGPGGATVATLLAQAGRRVRVLERATFPRFHIGESLLPYNRDIFEEMGVWEELEKLGCPRKFGAQFHLGDGSKALKLVFRDGCFTREPMAFQVERSVFDQLLLNRARCVGAEVSEGWTFQRSQTTGDRVEVEATDSAGERHAFSARFLVDASGRANVTGNLAGLREVHPRLRKISFFGHFEDVAVDEGEKAGDTVIVRLADAWFWLIPLAGGKVSVGCVVDQERFQRLGLEPRVVFDRAVAASPPLRDRMARARLVGDFHTAADFSYHNRRLVGSRLLRVGDAAGFLDPIFSSGVFVAMHTGRLAARVVAGALDAGTDGSEALRRYEKDVFRAFHFYWRMVEGFYTPWFMELFLEPRHRFSLPAAVNAALAGELSRAWSLRWRMRLFFWLVRCQRHVPLVPRIAWQPTWSA